MRLKNKQVKKIFTKGNLEGDLKKDFYGNPIKSYKEISKKVIVPSKKEIENNPRSRSAKLRFAIRNENTFSSINLSELGFESV